MAAHYVSAFRPLAEDPLLSEGSEALNNPSIHYFKHVEALLKLSGPEPIEPYLDYSREQSPSHDLSLYIPGVTSTAKEYATPPQSL